MITTPSAQTYAEAKQLLHSWNLVAFPTETVYGLGANALDTEAVSKIFATKWRPQTNPIIVHLGDVDQILDYAHITSPWEQLIIEKLMPGPLTILLHKKPNVPDMVTAGSDFVGIRIPQNQVARELLIEVNLPIAAPSANVSTKPSPTTAAMVRDNFGDKVPMIIDGGDCEVGIESTVVKVEDDRVIITRPWYITKEDLESILPTSVQVEYAVKVSEITPGNMFKHYSPGAKVRIFENFPTTELTHFAPEPSNKFEDKGFANSQFGPKAKILILATTERIEEYQAELASYTHTITVWNRWTKSNLISCAHNLFTMYHQADNEHFSDIFIEQLPEVGLWYAIMNRIKKSAE